MEIQGTDLPAARLLWFAGVLHRSGYAMAARNYLRGLWRLGYPTCFRETWPNFNFLPHFEDLEWIAAMSRRSPARDAVCVIQHPAISTRGFNLMEEFARQAPGVRRFVGFTTFETDRLPERWVDRLSSFEEIWVPSTFNLRAFERSGLDPKKLLAIPHAIDTGFFDPRRHSPAILPTDQGEFRFLSVFEWLPKKGWEVLLQAYCEEFAKGESVSLTLRTYRGSGASPFVNIVIMEQLQEFLRKQFGKTLDAFPPIHVDETRIPDAELPSYYLAHDAFVLPTRGEGWGYPIMEAMTLGMPTAATRWSGQLDYMNEENSYLIDIDGLVPVSNSMVIEHSDYAGHLWAQPSVAATRRAMRRMFENREEGQKKGQIARKQIEEKFSLECVAKKIVDRVEALKGSPVGKEEAFSPSPVVVAHATPLPEKPLRVAIRGGSARSFGHQRADYEISRRMNPESGFCFVEETESPEILISHDDPPSLVPPPSGCKWIWFARWHLRGALPTAWNDILQSRVDEVWIPDEDLRMAYLRAGVRESKIVVVPLGVDSGLFRPDVPAMELAPQTGSYRFLAVLPWDRGKGLDALLDWFFQTFRAADDVGLVVKIPPTVARPHEKDLRSVLNGRDPSPSLPPVTVIDRELSETEMAALYAACDAFVSPAHASFHSLSVLEAMASGLPVIAAESLGGHGLLSRDRSFSMRSLPETMPDEAREGAREAHGIRVHSLTACALMKEVWKNKDLSQDVALRALNHVRSERTWEKTVVWMRERIERLLRASGHEASERKSIRLFVPPGTAAPMAKFPFEVKALFATEEGGGLFGALHRQRWQDPQGTLALSSGLVEGLEKDLVLAMDSLDTEPDAMGVFLRQRDGVFALLRASFLPERLPTHERFASGAFLLELLRLADEGGAKSLLQMASSLRFPCDEAFAREAKAVDFLTLAQECRMGNRQEDALHYLGEALQCKPDYVACLAAKSEILIEQSRASEAVESAKKLFSLTPGWSRAAFLLGKAMIQGGQEDAGGLFLFRAFTMDHTDVEVLSEAAQLFARRGDLRLSYFFQKKIWQQASDRAECLEEILDLLIRNPELEDGSFLSELEQHFGVEQIGSMLRERVNLRRQEALLA